MSYSVLTISPFDKQLKRLAKKYPSIAGDYLDLIESLEEDPFQGDALGNNCYKIRWAIRSKGKGKRGGARVIANVVIVHSTVYLLSVYDKSEQTSLTDKELQNLLGQVPQ
ncbi:MAG: hypothetical protein ACKVOR_07205 [Flavobacteriales bacterium]